MVQMHHGKDQHLRKTNSGTFIMSALTALLAVGSYSCSQAADLICPIVVTSFTPASGHVGDIVTIVGESLGGTDAKVTFGGAESDPEAGSSETMLMVKVPLGAQKAQITVDVPSRQDCQRKTATDFTVLN
jgi:hypothetical protein